MNSATIYETLQKNKQLWNPDNIPMSLWYCLARALDNPNDKKQLKAKAMKRCCMFHGIENNGKNNQKSKATQFCEKYERFKGDFIKLCTMFNIKIRIYMCNYKQGRNNYYDVYDVHEPNDNDCSPEREEPEIVNLLILTPPYVEQELYMYIKNSELFSGYWLCPICNHHMLEADEKSSHFKRDKEAHLKECKEEQKKNRTKLEDLALPYIPQYTKNALYLFCKANNLNYEPIRYYITYDFETGDARTAKESAFDLQPVSVSMTVHGEEDTTKSYSVNDNPDRSLITEQQVWIKNFINDLYEYGREIYSANIRNFMSKNVEFIKTANDDKLNIFYDLVTKHNNNVHIIGFNSARFDIKLLNRYLISDTSNIERILGDCREVITKHLPGKNASK